MGLDARVSSTDDLKAAIAALEAQREELGNNIVDIAVKPLQTHLDALSSKNQVTKNAQRLKQVTVLFTDIVGSTVMVRQLDPEDVHTIMDGSLANLTTIINNHHGRVLQYAGDSLLAVFGADESHEEDPENAVRAGLAFLDASQEIAHEIENQYGLKGFQIRVGINTGRVLLGGGVESENSIRGITVHVAARMEQSAPAGGMRISHNTYRHIRGVFDVSEQPLIEVKGLAEPMRSYLVHDIKPRAFRSVSRGIDGIETPMVGRDAELTLLQQAFLSLFEKMHNHCSTTEVVTVVADAGIGKSRLLYEFENWAETQSAPYYIFKGRALPKTCQQPYGLLHDILTWRLQIAESDSAEVARNKLTETVAPLFETGEIAQIDILGHLVGLDFSTSPHLQGILDDPQQIRDQGFHVAAQIFRRIAQKKDMPSILILDDLQWADDDSLEFLNYLLDVNSDVPMLIIGMTRPELYKRHPAWLTNHANSLRIDLQLLSDAHSHQLTSELLNRLGNVPAVLRNLIMTSADGNPFYMEELIRMLIDDGAIIIDAGEWHLLPEKLLNTRVPDTLTGVLQARLDNLSVNERATLQRAAIIGYVFWDHTLAALDNRCVDALPALLQKELIVAQTTSTFEGACEYTFHHHVLHHVTYETVLKRDRQSFHLGTAIWYENLAKERAGDYLGATANHYKKAGKALRATHYYTLAAEDAASRHGRDATLHYVQQALELADNDDHPLRWRLFTAREKIFATQEDRIAHNADLDALELTANALDSDKFRAEALLRRAMAKCDSGDYPATEKIARSVLTFTQTPDTVAIAAQARGTQAFALRRMGNFPAAQPAAETGLRLAQEAGNRAIEGELLSNLAGLAAESGDLLKCFRLDEEYLAITRETGDQGREVNALNTMGDNALRLGDYSMARHTLDKALSLSRSIGSRYGECVVLLNLASLANLQNENTSAIGFAQESIIISEQSGLRDLEAAAMLMLGLALTGLGQNTRAYTALERSRDLFNENFSPHLAMEAIAALACIELVNGDSDKAIQHVEVVLQHLENNGSLDGTEEPLRILWMLYDVLQQVQDARAIELLAKAHQQLQKRAEKILDTQLRGAFLDNVPHNLAIKTAWRKQCSR